MVVWWRSKRNFDIIKKPTQERVKLANGKKCSNILILIIYRQCFNFLNNILLTFFKFALALSFSLDVCSHVCMVFIYQIFNKVQCFTSIKKLKRIFVSQRPTTTFKHSAKQSVEVLKPSYEIKSWVQCLKSLATRLSYNAWMNYAFYTVVFVGTVVLPNHFLCLCE